MVVFIRSLTDNWQYVAGFCLILAFLFLRQARLASREARSSIFRLEREQGFKQAGRARGRALFAIIVAVSAYAFSFHIVPLLRLPDVEDRYAQPTLAFFTPTATPTSALAVLSPPAISVTPEELRLTYSPTGAATPGGTPTPNGTPVAEGTSALAPALVASCPNRGVQIHSPGMGATVSGSVAITGVANIDGFQFYKVEIGAGEQPGAWTVVADTHAQPVNGGLIETWNTAPFPAGTYWLRLVVVDETGNYPSPCAVRVTLAK